MSDVDATTPPSRVLFGLGLQAVPLLCLTLAGGFALGYAVRPTEPPAVSAPTVLPRPDSPAPESVVKASPGPWGDLEYLPITIAPPEELLPVRALEEEPTRWFFPGATTYGLPGLLESLGCSPDERQQLLDPAGLQERPGGMQITPPRELFATLAAASRRALYQHLAAAPENKGGFYFVRERGLSERFRKGGVKDQTEARFRQQSCEHGDYLIFSGMSALLASMPSYEEKLRFLKALTSQKTLMIRLKIGPGTDVNALNHYWGKACWNMSVRSLLDSLVAVPGGTSLDLIEVLPPFPTSLLYTFPIAQNPLNGLPVVRDCHWTSFNFFHEVPDGRTADINYIAQKLKEDYFPVAADPRYGDIVLLSKADGAVVHSAVYLADGVAFTKNGDSSIHPWMYSTVPDMVDQYSFLVPPGEKLTVNYYRNKFQ